jgi:hypothetical protein
VWVGVRFVGLEFHFSTQSINPPPPDRRIRGTAGTNHDLHGNDTGNKNKKHKKKDKYSSVRGAVNPPLSDYPKSPAPILRPGP